MKKTLVAAAVLILALLAPGQGARIRGTLVLNDTATTRRDRRLHDVQRVELSASGGRMQVRVVFFQDLKNGMFTKVTTAIDCDNKATTGLNGIELMFVASVGSRYQPNNAAARGAAVAPWNMRRCSYKYLRKQTKRGSGSSFKTFFNSTHKELTKPDVAGRVFTYSFPLGMLRDAGLRYNNTIQVYVTVQGTISEEVLSLDYVCGGDGLPVVIDGIGSDWPRDGASARDAVGDMHPAAQSVDIRDLRVEHYKDLLLARVRVARPVGRRRRQDDISDRDRIHLGVEPLGSKTYMAFQEVVVYAREQVRGFTNAASSIRGLPVRRAGYAYGVKGRVFEFAVKRRTEQTRFRVMVWADADRMDRIPNENTAAFRIPKGAWE